MTARLLKALPLGVFAALAISLVAIRPAPAQQPIPLVTPGGRPQPEPLPLPGQPPAQGEGIEVLARGPVHEAFAATAEAPVASPVVPKAPPEPIEELPPDQKPEGDNVQWIPGYWHWDEEGSQFIWVSGFWRQPPPGRVWVPGSWRDVRGGSQYVPGFWQELAPQQPQQLQPVQPEIEYLPEPPQSLEVGPTVAAPNAACVYVPGSWVWRNKYLWRPGVWIDYRPHWVWVPARFTWTPAGYVFCDGYWDYPLATRGVLFAPVAFAQPIYAQPAFVYTPAYVVSAPCMTGALFVRRGYGNYYFGDYFDNRYATRGYSAWCGTVGRSGFNLGFGTGRGYGYDPLWSYYSATYRDTPRWRGGVNDLYAGRYGGTVVRPPTTLVQQNTTINNITRTNVTNVTNNITVVDGAARVGNRDVSNVAMVAPLRVAPDLQRTKFEAVNAQGRRDEARVAKQTRDVGAQRTRLETAAAAQPRTPPVATPNNPRPAAAPRTITLDVPKAAAQRVHAAPTGKGPPPNPLRATPGAGAKIDPPKVEPQPKANPMPLPKVEVPKGEPRPKENPRPKGEPTPKSNPNPNPQPVPLPKVEVPKTDPRPKGEPATNPRPRTDPPAVNPQPKTDPRPKGEPRVEPKPPNPVPPPKVEPPKGKVRVEPTPVPVPPKVEPKVEPKAPAPVPPPKVNPVRPKVEPRPQPPAPQPVAPPVPQPQPGGKGRPQPVPVPQPPAPVPPRPQQPAPPAPQPPPPVPVPQPPVPPRPQPPAVERRPQPPVPQPQPPVAPPVGKVRPQPPAPPVVQPQPPAPPRVNPPVQPRSQPPAPPAPPPVAPRVNPPVQPRTQPPAPVQPPTAPQVGKTQPAPPAPPAGQPASPPTGKKRR